MFLSVRYVSYSIFNEGQDIFLSFKLSIKGSSYGYSPLLYFYDIYVLFN